MLRSCPLPFILVCPTCMLRSRPYNSHPHVITCPFALVVIGVQIPRWVPLHVRAVSSVGTRCNSWRPAVLVWGTIPARILLDALCNSCPHASLPPVGIRSHVPLQFPPACPFAPVGIRSCIPCWHLLQLAPACLPLTPFRNSHLDVPWVPVGILTQIPPSHPLEISLTCIVGVHCNFCLHPALAPVGICAHMAPWHPLQFPPTRRVGAHRNSCSDALDAAAILAHMLHCPPLEFPPVLIGIQGNCKSS